MTESLKAPLARSQAERGARVRRAQALTFWTETRRIQRERATAAEGHGSHAGAAERRQYAYAHNGFSIRTVNMHPDECANEHARCQHLLLATSQTIPLADGELDLGEWQRIFGLELDRARDRQLVVQVVGV